MPILSLIPVIFFWAEKIFGDIPTGVKQNIVTSLLSRFEDSPTVSTVLDVFQGALGNIDSEKQAELKAKLETLLAQADIEKAAIQTGSIFLGGARAFIEWGLGANVVAYSTIVSIANICQFFGYQIGTLRPLDALTIGLLAGLLGLYNITDAYKKKNGV